MPAAVVVPALIGGGATVAGAVISSHAAGDAANTQTAAANQAAQLQAQSAKEALDFQKQQWATAQANAQPWIEAGQGATRSLADLLGIPMTGASAAGATNAVQSASTLGDAVAPRSSNPGQYWAMSGPPNVAPGADHPSPPREDLAMTYGENPGLEQTPSRPRDLHMSGYGAGTLGAATESGYVTMRAPDGTTQQVPLGDVVHYAQQGAQIVGS